MVDQNVDLTLSNAYFGYTGIQNTTVNVGKQGLTTPWTMPVDSDGNGKQTGTGILTMSNGSCNFSCYLFNHNT